MLFLPHKKHLQNARPEPCSDLGAWGIPQQAKMRLGSTQTLLAAMKSKNFFNGCSRNLSRFEHGYLKCRCYHSAAGNSLVGQIITGRMIPIKIACTGFFRFISVSTPRSISEHDSEVSSVERQTFLPVGLVPHQSDPGYLPHIVKQSLGWQSSRL